MTGTLAGASDESLQKFLGKHQRTARGKKPSKPLKVRIGVHSILQQQSLFGERPATSSKYRCKNDPMQTNAASILPAIFESLEDGPLCGAPAGNLCEEGQPSKQSAEQTGKPCHLWKVTCCAAPHLPRDNIQSHAKPL